MQIKEFNKHIILASLLGAGFREKPKHVYRNSVTESVREFEGLSWHSDVSRGAKRNSGRQANVRIRRAIRQECLTALMEMEQEPILLAKEAQEEEWDLLLAMEMEQEWADREAYIQELMDDYDDYYDDYDNYCSMNYPLLEYDW